MCEDKKSCSCGCSTKKPLKEAKEDIDQFKKIIVKLETFTTGEFVNGRKGIVPEVEQEYLLRFKQEIKNLASSLPEFDVSEVLYATNRIELSDTLKREIKTFEKRNNIQPFIRFREEPGTLLNPDGKTPYRESKILKEGTWAPHVWSKEVAIKAKNILQGIIESNDPKLDVEKLLNRFEKKFFNQIGDDMLYDYINQAALEYRKKRPTWKPRLTAAIARINQLESSYAQDGRIKESIKKKSDLLEKINLKLTSNTKIELVKQAKIALDAIYMIYDKAEKREVSHDGFLNIVDETFEKISELLAVLIGQESVESPTKK